MGYKKAAKEFGVPRNTLKRRHLGINKNAKGSSKILGSYTAVFSADIERELVQYILTMEGMMFGITCKEVRGLAFEMAERNNIPHPFKNGVAGKDWLQGFMSRHPELSLRQPEATSAARAHGFNRQSVNRFFDLLTALVEEHNFPPDKIYNVDETGMTTVQTRPSNIIALRGKRQVGALTSAERGTLVTTEICMSATGSFVPPMFVWPRVRMKPELMDECPPGSISECHNSGWMQTNIFTIWFQYFVKVSGATTDNKVLLILDGHATQTHNLNVINMARENGVYLLSLPPHCSHKLQPLDVAFMKPLSTYYTQAVETWLRQHPGRRVTYFKLPACSGKHISNQPQHRMPQVDSEKRGFIHLIATSSKIMNLLLRNWQTQLIRDTMLLPDQRLMSRDPMLLSERRLMSTDPMLLSGRRLMSTGLMLLPDQRLMSRDQVLLSEGRVMSTDLMLLPDQRVMSTDLMLLPDQRLMTTDLMLLPDQRVMSTDLMLLPDQRLMSTGLMLLPDQRLMSRDQVLLSEGRVMSTDLMLLPDQRLMSRDPMLQSERRLMSTFLMILSERRLISTYLMLLPDQRLMSRDPMLLSDRRLMSRDPFLVHQVSFHHL